MVLTRKLKPSSTVDWAIFMAAGQLCRGILGAQGISLAGCSSRPHYSGHAMDSKGVEGSQVRSVWPSGTYGALACRARSRAPSRHGRLAVAGLVGAPIPHGIAPLAAPGRTASRGELLSPHGFPAAGNRGPPTCPSARS